MLTLKSVKHIWDCDFKFFFDFALKLLNKRLKSYQILKLLSVGNRNASESIVIFNWTKKYHRSVDINSKINKLLNLWPSGKSLPTNVT